MHNDELLVPDENDDPREMSELGRLADFISGSVPEKEFRNFGAATKRKKFKVSISHSGRRHFTYLFPIVRMLSTDR